MLDTQLALLLEQIKSRPDIKPLIKAHIASKGVSKESEKLIDVLTQIEKEDAPVKASLESAWRTAFMAMYDAGKLGPMTNNSNTIFEDRWNMLFNKDHIANYVFDDVIEALVETSFQVLTSKKSIKKAAKRATEMLDNIAKGDLVLTRGNQQFFTNFSDGATLHVSMSNWHCDFLMQRVDNGKEVFVAPTKNPDNLVISTHVNFPSGNLIVADRIDVKGFHNLVKKLWKENGTSHIYALHRLSATIYEISALGSINIVSRSDDPGLVMGQDGNLFCGHEDDDFMLKASPVRDIWQTHMVDEKTLHDTLVSSGVSSANAQKAIDDWVDENNITSVAVEPGDWTLFFGENPETLQKVLAEENIPHPKNATIALIAGKVKTSAKNVHHIETSS